MALAVHDDERKRWLWQQRTFAQQVVTDVDDVVWSKPRYVGGLDISFFGEADAVTGHDKAVAALVVVELPGLRVVWEQLQEVMLDVPYIPGFLGFRECPSFLPLLEQVKGTEFDPDVLLVDGFGVLHHEGCGSASQLGVLSGYPTIGVAKTLLAVDGLDQGEVEARVAAALLRHAGAGCVQLRGQGRQQRQQEEEQRTVDQQQHHEQQQQEEQSHQPAAEAQQQEGSMQGSPGAAAPCRQAPCGGGSTTDCPGTGQQASSGEVAPAGAATGQVPGVTEAPAATSTGQVAAEEMVAVAGGTGRTLPLVGASGRVLGAALCSKSSNKPVFVSVGHRLCLPTAVEVVARCCQYRIPEPIRQADLRSREYIRQYNLRRAAAVAAARVGS